MRFDARAAKLLKPGEHIIVDGAPGLRLVATETRRTWIYRFKSPVDGRMRQIKIGEWPALSVGVASAEWEKLRQQRDAGSDPAAEKRAVRQAAAAPAAKGYTVRMMLDDYLAGHVRPHRKPKGATEVARLFDKLAAPIAGRQAASITRTQAFELLESLAATPVQAAQLRQELGAAVDLALDAGRLPEETPNWWRLIMRGRLRSKGKKIAGKRVGTAKRSLSDAEAGELIRWLPNFSKAVADVLTLYLWTGCRGGELVQIEGREVAQEADGLWLVIPKAKTKNARHAEATDLRVPLVGRAEEIVRRRLAVHPAGYLFPAARPGKLPHIDQKAVQTAVHYFQPYSRTRSEVARARLTVTHWAPHDLRRTARTMLAALGCPADVAEAVLGHMQPGVVGIYNLHRYDSERREWLTRLADHLERCAAARADAHAPQGGGRMSDTGRDSSHSSSSRTR